MTQTLTTEQTPTKDRLLQLLADWSSPCTWRNASEFARRAKQEQEIATECFNPENPGLYNYHTATAEGYQQQFQSMVSEHSEILNGLKEFAPEQVGAFPVDRIHGEGYTPTDEQFNDLAQRIFAIWNAVRTKVPDHDPERDPLRLTVASASTAMMSAPDLAKKYEVDRSRLRKRLDRWRQHRDKGYSELTNNKPNEPRYLYDEGAVREIILELKSGHPTGIEK